MTASSSNSLINELKSAFLLTDPVSFNNEYSRDIYYNSLNFFDYAVVQGLIKNLNDSFSLSPYINSFLYYFLNNKNSNTMRPNYELLKNQYRPMRKGITNMIRLHATGAIALPTDVKMQILASSKDVIHS